MEDNKAFNEAYEKALSLLNISMHTEKLLTDKLKRRKYSDDIIEAVIQRVKEYGYVDDRAYADTFVRNLVAYKHIGPSKLINKLISKGIDPDTASVCATQAIDEFGGEYEVLCEFIRKNHMAIKRLIDKDDEVKFKKKLYNQGFSVYTINNALSEIEDILAENDDPSIL